MPQITMRERCGNAGAVESVESQRQASHSFHEPLGNLANTRRDSHIPTAPTTRAMEKWKTKSRFSTFPPPRFLSLKTKTQKPNAGLRPAYQNQRKETPHSTDIYLTISSSFRIGMNLSFQAHLALESILDFRLISGLENA
jgi:hypothetical protein